MATTSIASPRLYTSLCTDTFPSAWMPFLLTVDARIRIREARIIERVRGSFGRKRFEAKRQFTREFWPTGKTGEIANHRTAL